MRRIKVTVEYIMEDFIDNADLIRNYDGDISQCYHDVVGEDSPESYSSDRKIVKVELLPKTQLA